MADSKTAVPAAAPAATQPEWLRQLVEARRVATSLVCISTLDARAAIQQMTPLLTQGLDKDAPIIEWDIVRGAIGTNPQGETAMVSLLSSLGQGVDAATATGALPEFLYLCPKITTRAIVYFHNLHLFLDNPGVQQGLWNLRDVWMSKKAMAVGLGPEFNLPPTLVNDMLVFEEPAPNDDQIRSIAEKRLRTASGPMDPKVIQETTLALRGVGSPFLVDQVLSMSTRNGIVRTSDLWERKRQTINAIKGLDVQSSLAQVTELGGLTRLKPFFRNGLDNSPTGRPAALVFVDEVEKSLGGAGTSGAGDSSGVSQDQLGQLLRMTEDWESLASLFLGVGGVAKTAFARWFAYKNNLMMIDMDLGAMKGSYVGQSEQQVRMASRTLKAISGGRPGSLWFVFVCNKLEVLPPEFKRRMNMGMWFFDLPTPEERIDIWAIHRERFKIDPTYDKPVDKGWTGAEIRNCCQLAWRLGVDLVEAATYVVPLVASEGGPQGAIERLHTVADHRFLNVNAPGQYDHRKACPNAPNSEVDVPVTAGGRAIDAADA